MRSRDSYLYLFNDCAKLLEVFYSTDYQYKWNFAEDEECGIYVERSVESVD